MTDDYDAVVYDLDGTLVRLDVDWATVRREAAAALRERGVDADGRDLWAMLDLAEERGHADAVESVVADHEVEGAESSELLTLVDELPLSVPVGVVSLNCESAVRRALELHGADEHVDAVAGRDTLDARKPDPTPLLWIAGELGVDPERSLFVGDSRSDAEAAEAAGFDFEWASDRGA
ncbi:HAD family hydrolase [Halomicrobium salinisoli]|uniref:HAD family hydrolase n=1 Tax=Halomicrobium salinisoli TaxID=2878391 RepID=UPI001CF075DE|nr:HAD-IA family hydrolase [Halomicrobium salinisoli]